MRILDLYCCAGGAARGYHDAGFDEIVGVDINPQPRYPYHFVQGDAIEFLREKGHLFDAVHASPPCQRYSKATRANPGRAELHPDLLAPTRLALLRAGIPYIIENVPPAPLLSPVMLCGTMFDLQVFRHRLFESNVPLRAPKAHHKHQGSTGTHRWPYVFGGYYEIAGSGWKGWTIEQGRAAMGIDWPVTRKELVEAIPPAYTRHLGAQLLAHLRGRREEAAD